MCLLIKVETFKDIAEHNPYSLSPQGGEVIIVAECGRLRGSAHYAADLLWVGLSVNNALHCTVMHYSILHYMVLHCAALHCAVETFINTQMFV